MNLSKCHTISNISTDDNDKDKYKDEDNDDQCLKLMVGQSPLVIKNWAGPVKFDPGQAKITIDYIRREIFWTFLHVLGD